MLTKDQLSSFKWNICWFYRIRHFCSYWEDFLFQSPELEARIQRLKAEQANREYKEMVRSVDKEQVHSGLNLDGFIFSVIGMQDLTNLLRIIFFSQIWFVCSVYNCVYIMIKFKRNECLYSFCSMFFNVLFLIKQFCQL